MNVPKNAARLSATAEANGWAVRATESSGTTIGRRGNVDVESYGVRFAKGSARAFGVWVREWETVSWKYDNGQATVKLSSGSLLFPPRVLGYRDLARVLVPE